ncbi:MAG: hypothetical protein JJT94_15470 [Bernardetiaceae bacterium]|nr:hypothetical protein [Bernardetiaceae bacterium]
MSQKTIKILEEKIEALQEDWAIASGSQKFTLKKQIERAEKELAELKKKNSGATSNNKKTEKDDGSIKPPAPPINPLLLLGLGVAFVLLGFGGAVLIPCPTDIMYISIRIVFALGGGFLGGYMIGFLNISLKGMQAGGGLAVFAVLFWWNPAAPIIKPKNCDDKLIISGIIYVDNRPFENLKVKLPQLERQRSSNRDGKYEFEVNASDLKASLDFYLLFENVDFDFKIDTLISLETEEITDWSDLNFYPIKVPKPEEPKPTPPDDKKAKKEPEKVPHTPKTDKPQVELYSLKIEGNLGQVKKFLFDGNAYQPDENGYLKLPLAKTDKELQVVFEDNGKETHTYKVFQGKEKITIMD